MSNRVPFEGKTIMRLAFEDALANAKGPATNNLRKTVRRLLARRTGTWKCRPWVVTHNGKPVRRKKRQRKKS